MLRIVTALLFLLLVVVVKPSYAQPSWQVFAPDGSFFYKTCDYIRYVGDDRFCYERGERNWRVCDNKGIDIAPFGIQIWNKDLFRNGMTPAYIMNDGKEERVVIDKFGQIVSSSLQKKYNRPIWLNGVFNGYKNDGASCKGTVDASKLNPLIDEKIAGFEKFKIEYRKANKPPSFLEILVKGFEIATGVYE